mmetsp:Transcript_70272/g.164577  ORF Transcript_70272/g.164577 Transcript_70272/m.164577 type:complete len:250 (-) Transcript_70272:289-1038(-)
MKVVFELLRGQSDATVLLVGVNHVAFHLRASWEHLVNPLVRRFLARDVPHVQHAFRLVWTIECHDEPFGTVLEDNGIDDHSSLQFLSFGYGPLLLQPHVVGEDGLCLSGAPIEVRPRAVLLLFVDALHGGRQTLHLQLLPHAGAVVRCGLALFASWHETNQTGVEHLDLAAFLINMQNSHIPKDLLTFFPCLNHAPSQDLESKAVVSLPDRQGCRVPGFLNVPPLSLKPILCRSVAGCHCRGVTTRSAP